MGCNRIKGDAWPTLSERRRGRRFADPCKEQDYAVHFIENEDAELVPQSPCGELHVQMLRLNRRHRVARRRERNDVAAHLSEALSVIERLEQQSPTRQQREVIGHL